MFKILLLKANFIDDLHYSLIDFPGSQEKFRQVEKYSCNL